MEWDRTGQHMGASWQPPRCAYQSLADDEGGGEGVNKFGGSRCPGQGRIKVPDGPWRWHGQLDASRPVRPGQGDRTRQWTTFRVDFPAALLASATGGRGGTSRDDPAVTAPNWAVIRPVPARRAIL